MQGDAPALPGAGNAPGHPVAARACALEKAQDAGEVQESWKKPEWHPHPTSTQFNFQQKASASSVAAVTAFCPDTLVLDFRVVM